MLDIKLRAYFIVLLLVVFLLGITVKSWLLLTLGTLSLICAVVYFIYFLFEESFEDFSLRDFIFGEED